MGSSLFPVGSRGLLRLAVAPSCGDLHRGEQDGPEVGGVLGQVDLRVGVQVLYLQAVASLQVGHACNTRHGGQLRGGQVRGGQVRGGQVRSGQVRSGEGRGGQDGPEVGGVLGQVDLRVGVQVLYLQSVASLQVGHACNTRHGTARSAQLSSGQGRSGEGRWGEMR